jgi:hypothetical protein
MIMVLKQQKADSITEFKISKGQVVIIISAKNQSHDREGFVSKTAPYK